MASLALELPAHRDWYWCDPKERRRMLEFRLVYQGLLPSNADSKTKQAIRRYLHKQLMNAWEVKYPLKAKAVSVATINGSTNETEISHIPTIARKYEINGKRYVPIINHADKLVCGLDILLLRRDFSSVIESGDLDNRAKTGI